MADFFLQTGNSYISAVDWVIPTKFGLPIHFDIVKRATSPNPKPEVKLRHSGRHIENRYDMITPPTMVRFAYTLHQCVMKCRDQIRNWNSNMADICFSKPKVVISQPSVDIVSTILGL